MTAEELITELGKRAVNVSRRSLFIYRKIDPREAPDFSDVDSWARFIHERQVYEAGRTDSPEKSEAKELKAMSGNGRKQARRNLANGDSDAEKYSVSAERKEGILRLRLSNAVRRSKLERLSQNTVTMAECTQAMAHIRSAVSDDLLKLPPSLCHELADKNPQSVQQVLNTALRSALDRLARTENYLDLNP